MNNECNENGRVSLAASLGDKDLCGDEGLNGCFIYIEAVAMGICGFEQAISSLIISSYRGRN